MASMVLFQTQKLRTTLMNKLDTTISYNVVGKKVVSIGELTGSKVRILLTPE